MSRKVVGIYDRPHPLRRRQVWVPLAIAAASVAFWLVVWFAT